MWEKLAPDTGVNDDGADWSGITLAHNVGYREEVASGEVILGWASVPE
jgi:hypothetical protein